MSPALSPPEVLGSVPASDSPKEPTQSGIVAQSLPEISQSNTIRQVTPEDQHSSNASPTQSDASLSGTVRISNASGAKTINIKRVDGNVNSDPDTEDGRSKTMTETHTTETLPSGNSTHVKTLVKQFLTAFSSKLESVKKKLLPGSFTTKTTVPALNLNQESNSNTGTQIRNSRELPFQHTLLEVKSSIAPGGQVNEMINHDQYNGIVHPNGLSDATESFPAQKVGSHVFSNTEVKATHGVVHRRSTSRPALGHNNNMLDSENSLSSTTVDYNSMSTNNHAPVRKVQSVPTRPNEMRTRKVLTLLGMPINGGANNVMPTSNTSCGCSDVVDNVCGADGKTYKNLCHLHCV